MPPARGRHCKGGVRRGPTPAPRSAPNERLHTRGTMWEACVGSAGQTTQQWPRDQPSQGPARAKLVRCSRFGSRSHLAAAAQRQSAGPIKGVPITTAPEGARRGTEEPEARPNRRAAAPPHPKERKAPQVGHTILCDRKDWRAFGVPSACPRRDRRPSVLFLVCPYQSAAGPRVRLPRRVTRASLNKAVPFPTWRRGLADDAAPHW